MPRRQREATEAAIDLVEAALGDWCNEVREVPVEAKYKSKNLEAERRRRTKLNGKLLELRSLRWRCSQMSKESTLMDAISYIKELEQKKAELQMELAQIPDEDGGKQGSLSSTGMTTMTVPLEVVQLQGKVELSPIGVNKYHLGIIFKNKEGAFVKLLESLSKVGAEVTAVSSVAFSGFSETVLCIEVKDEERFSMAQLKQQLLSMV
ncbi:hypothetical protein ZIOFF_036438 [Zingiber officinale]|uniref:BHLH domain-containing protein n=1 Tax=Zingiber officinale TaxID=94328 RepID=A0A8J5GI70_ZINOF|nr:hypothetical protein ZIOFF_036438 [Zingiber officinale]